MKREHLRLMLLAVCACGVLLWAYNNFIYWSGTSPITIASTPSGWKVKSAASGLNIKAGDRVDLSRVDALQRWEYFATFPKGTKLTYYVIRGNVASKIVVDSLVPHFDVEWLGQIGVVWMLLFASVILVRGKPSKRTDLLAGILILWAISNQVWSGNLYTPWVALSVTCELLGLGLNTYLVVLMVLYAHTFGTLSPLRRVLAIVSIVGGVGITAFGSGVLGIVFDNAWFAWLGIQGIPIAWAVAMYGVVACLIAAIRSAGRERDEAMWVAAPMAVTALFQGAIIAASIHHVPGLWIIEKGLSIAFLVFPLGLTYASLSRRVVDVGFAINRAAVYTGVSLVIVATFVLGEWLLGKWIDEANPTTGLVVNGALAVGLGLSIRFVHSRVDRILDTLFFRKRHEDEHAIRAFAQEAAYITDTNVVLERTIAVLQQHADASFVHISDANGNDPALVALRAWHKRVDLETIDGTAIEGEWAYPMVARGHVLGALILGPKRSGESYAPDESDAIAHLAHGVAAALDALKRSDEGRLVRIEQMLEALPQRIADALSTMRVTEP